MGDRFTTVRQDIGKMTREEVDGMGSRLPRDAPLRRHRLFDPRPLRPCRFGARSWRPRGSGVEKQCLAGGGTVPPPSGDAAPVAPAPKAPATELSVGVRARTAKEKGSPAAAGLQLGIARDLTDRRARPGPASVSRRHLSLGLWLANDSRLQAAVAPTVFGAAMGSNRTTPTRILRASCRWRSLDLVR